MPRRERFVTDVGPLAAGSKPVMEVCAHTPERSGCAERSALLPAGCAACDNPDAAASTVARTKKPCCRKLRRASLSQPSPEFPEKILHILPRRVNWPQSAENGYNCSN